MPSESEVEEIAAMFPNAEYQPTLNADEVDPCYFCKGTIDDHKANCVVPHVHALCATVKALRAENEWQKSSIEQFTIGGTGCAERLATLQSQLAAVERERDELRQRLEGEQAMDLITDRTLKPGVGEAIERLK